MICLKKFNTAIATLFFVLCAVLFCDPAYADENNSQQLDNSLMPAKKAVYFGDSYLRSQPESLGWGNFFTEFSGMNEIGRYKSGGAGWVYKGKNDTEVGLNFGEMLNKSAAEISQVLNSV